MSWEALPSEVAANVMICQHFETVTEKPEALKYSKSPFQAFLFTVPVYPVYQVMASLCFCCDKASFLLSLGGFAKLMGCAMIIKLTPLLGCLYCFSFKF